MVGHLHAAAKARLLGHDIRPDGRKGRGRQWAVVGVAEALCERFSKRNDQIARYMAESGYQCDRAERIAPGRPGHRNAGPVGMNTDHAVLGLGPNGGKHRRRP